MSETKRVTFSHAEGEYAAFHDFVSGQWFLLNAKQIAAAQPALVKDEAHVLERRASGWFLLPR